MFLAIFMWIILRYDIFKWKNCDVEQIMSYWVSSCEFVEIDDSYTP